MPQKSLALIILAIYLIVVGLGIAGLYIPLLACILALVAGILLLLGR